MSMPSWQRRRSRINMAMRVNTLLAETGSPPILYHCRHGCDAGHAQVKGRRCLVAKNADDTLLVGRGLTGSCRQVRRKRRGHGEAPAVGSREEAGQGSPSTASCHGGPGVAAPHTVANLVEGGAEAMVGEKLSPWLQ